MIAAADVISTAVGILKFNINDEFDGQVQGYSITPFLCLLNKAYITVHYDTI